jgi:hypothetical protein
VEDSREEVGEKEEKRRTCSKVATALVCMHRDTTRMSGLRQERQGVVSKSLKSEASR